MAHEPRWNFRYLFLVWGLRDQRRLSEASMTRATGSQEAAQGRPRVASSVSVAAVRPAERGEVALLHKVPAEP
jgi:hypothetical protein